MSKPIGPVAAIAWMLAIVIAMDVLQTLYGGYLVSAASGKPFDVSAQHWTDYADLQMLATGMSMLAAQLLLVVIVAAYGWRLSEKWPLATSARTLGRWILYTVVFYAAGDAVMWLARGRVTDPFDVSLYRAMSQPALQWIMAIAIAPVFEECLMRGFVLPALASTRLRVWGAIAVTSALWAAAHVQYDALGMLTIAALGLLLGAARMRTGSIAVPIAMHSLNNLATTIEVVLASARP